SAPRAIRLHHPGRSADPSIGRYAHLIGYGGYRRSSDPSRRHTSSPGTESSCYFEIPDCPLHCLEWIASRSGALLHAGRVRLFFTEKGTSSSMNAMRELINTPRAVPKSMMSELSLASRRSRV